jgi:hypothetical protein
VEFGNFRSIPVLGVLAGVVIAVGLPVATLIWGTDLGAFAQVAIIILALLVGGAVAGISAFFGTVIPSHVGPGPGTVRAGPVNYRLEVSDKCKPQPEPGKDAATGQEQKPG